MMRTLIALLLLCALSGCSLLDELPAGSQLQSSTFGIRLAPQDPTGTPLTIGSHTTILTTPPPEKTGPGLNRYELAAPGIASKSTSAIGGVGEQLEKAGGPEALGHLVNPAESRPLIELPRTDTEPEPESETPAE